MTSDKKPEERVSLTIEIRGGNTCALTPKSECSGIGIDRFDCTAQVLVRVMVFPGVRFGRAILKKPEKTPGKNNTGEIEKMY